MIRAPFRSAEAMYRLLAPALLAMLGLTGCAHSPAASTSSLASPYRVERPLAIGGLGRWDLLAIDSGRHHLFLSRSAHVDIIDTVSGERIGTLAGTDGVHGIAIAPGLMRGYATNGHSDTVSEFDLATFARIRDFPVNGHSPDAVLFDEGSGHLFVFNARSNNASVIDPASGKEIATIAFGGNPELPAADGHGHVFVNIEDKAQLVRIDTATLKILDTWPLAGCEEPSGLALDAAHDRLFSTCQNQVVVVTDAGDGRQVARLAIGEGPDGAAFDAQRQLAFIPSGKSGLLTLVHEDDPDHFRIVQTLPTQVSARTIALDPQTHRLYLPAARFEPQPEGSKERPPMVADSFTVLEVGDGEGR
jgi:YVTN family beta-propeller protein